MHIYVSFIGMKCHSSM